MTPETLEEDILGLAQIIVVEMKSEPDEVWSNDAEDPLRFPAPPEEN